MLILAVISNESRDGQRRAAGRTIQHRVAIGVDNYNVVLAETTGPKFVGKKFSGSLKQLSKLLTEEDDIDVPAALDLVRTNLNTYFPGRVTPKMTWEDLDREFGFPKRTEDSTGKLAIHGLLKKAGCPDDSGNNDDDDADE